MITGAIIMAEAASIYEGVNACQSQSYGPEARGGSSKADCVISKEEIDYPKATRLDLLLAMTQESADKYTADLKPDGLLIIDEDNVENVPTFGGQIVKLPITAIAREQVGKMFVINIVSLGAITELTGVVSEDSVRKAILNRVPKGTEELNMKAFELGQKAARNHTS
jgi:2-oxoglutarate ferredoxin oxidoreductase subunit gamma